jgi:magnesium chelatase family protein
MTTDTRPQVAAGGAHHGIGPVRLRRRSGRRPGTTRTGDTGEFPACVALLAAMNPCKCGWLGHPKRGCRCTPTEIAQHHAGVSGPVLDRLDFQTEVPALSGTEIQSASPAEASVIVRARVLAPRTPAR